MSDRRPSAGTSRTDRSSRPGAAAPAEEGRPRELDRSGAVATIEDASPPGGQAIRFRDRADAGRRLASLLEAHRSDEPVILAMPRGGVPVAAEVARALGAPLDLAVVRKVGAPRNPEFAVGAVAENGIRLISERAARALRLGPARLAALLEAAEADLGDCVRRYREGRPPLEVTGRTAILVDDGLATGRSAHAALLSLRARGAERLILAVPVAAPESVLELAPLAEEIVCVEQPRDMWAVGHWYEDFAPASDADVAAALARAGAAGG